MNRLLEAIASPFGRLFGLDHFARNFPLITYSALAYTAIHLWFAPYVSRKLVPASYAKLQTQKAKNNWDIHIVSLANAFAVIILAARAINAPGLELNKAFGSHIYAETANAVACGYFLWDTVDAIFNFTDAAFALHGFACFVTYTLTFGPYFQYYAPRFLLWEISTIFLNIHWFMDKTGYTGTTPQLINGIVLIATFVGARIGYGWYTNIGFFRTFFPARREVPIIYWLLILVGHLTINVLNIVWLAKMIRALRNRFDKDPAKRPLLPRSVDSRPVNPPLPF